MKLFRLALLALILLPATTQAQCKGFAKKSGRPALAEYSENIQLNSTIVRPGDEAEIMLTFYANTSNRIVVVGHEQLGDISFKIYDMDHNLLFESDSSNTALTFDFKVVSTRQLILEIVIPDDNSNNANDIYTEGCVIILTGKKE